MPVYHNSSARKSKGFSIDDIIRSETFTKPSSPSTIFTPPLTWFPPPSPNLYHFQRQSMLQLFRHTNQFSHPGAAFAAAYLLNSYRKPKRNRTAFTPSQLLKLENEFEKNHYIVGQERKDLAKHLNLPEAKVKVWYQNRRTKHKRLNHEDSQSSSNEINESDFLIKIDDEDSWNTDEENQQ